MKPTLQVWLAVITAQDLRPLAQQQLSLNEIQFLRSHAIDFVTEAEGEPSHE
jgi:hypothetical protein